ncbi:MAG TPA: HD domain-containing phosphohydrolase [Negativicutes bacterium]|nr:HD domain-containing phosphohydrolase [Negativicutes bacterium]
MGLSRKIAILQVLLIVCFVGVMLIVGQFVWGQSFLRLEQDEINDNVIRTRLAWEEELNLLGSLVGDWAPWDDMYAFAADPASGDFVEKNLADSAMANLKINVAIVADSQGQALFAKAIDLEQKVEDKVPAALITEISKLAGAGRLKPAGDESVKGFVMVGSNPVLFASQRILTSDKKGSSNGLLIFAKYGDTELFTEIRRRTQVKVDFAIGADVPATADAGVVRQEVRDDVVRAYYPLFDAYGRDGYFLASVTPRVIYQQGQVQMRAFLLAAILLGALLTAITLFFLDRLVLARLRKMGAFINSIIAEKDYSVRLDLPGSDELAGAAAAMNDMLTEIEASHKEITGLLDSVKRELAERKTAERNLRYLSMHDPLTGLCNRAFFEEEIARIALRRPRGVGAICCDLDGLKLINDTMGHAVGDRVLREVAAIISEASVDTGGFVARLGGDEFTVVLTDVDEETVMQGSRRMRRTVEIGDFGGVGLKLNLSVGWAFYGGPGLSEEMLRSLVKEADDFMYRRKLSSSRSNRNTLVHGMMELLKVRDFITEGHSQRLQGHAVSMGKLLGLKDTQVVDLRLLAQFHDIGKVGISDALLVKPGPLTAEERKEMERHAEIGFRIAQSVPEFFPISDFILKHHEWWNGAGYPLGLKEEEIPVECRILAIADAFDAMINDRPYRRAMTQDEAVAELKRFAGVQFDPELVKVFVRDVLGAGWE